MFRACSAALFAALLLAPAAAQVPEIRLARQFSMGYLQFNVMEHHGLIEKHARGVYSIWPPSDFISSA